MTAQDIITAFELQVSDMTGLSTDEELLVLDRVYKEVCADRPWEFLKKIGTGVITVDPVTGIAYIDLPEDFSFFAENRSYTGNSREYYGDSAPKAVFVNNGNNAYAPFTIVNFSDRMQYLNAGNYAYVDYGQMKIIFTGPTNNTYLSNGVAFTFDYICTPPTLGLADSPIFPATYHHILVFKMAVQSDIIELSDKARSYQAENQKQADNWLVKLQYWNANLFNN